MALCADAVAFHAPASCVDEARTVLSARTIETTRPSVALVASEAVDHTDGPTSKNIVYVTPDVFAAMPAD
jgi:hypothetical protein